MKATWPPYFSRFFTALAARGDVLAGGVGSRSEWKARCPAHEDKVHSLSIGRGRKGNLILRCHAPAGCTVEMICRELGVSLADLYPDEEERRRDRDERLKRDAELARSASSDWAAEQCYRGVAGVQPVCNTPKVEHASFPAGMLSPPVRVAHTDRQQSGLSTSKGKSVSTGNASGRRLVKVSDYRDESGVLLFQSLRFDPKGFGQRRPNPNFDASQPPSVENPQWINNLNDTRRVLYKLDSLVAAWREKPGKVVIVVEGEKDADLLTAAGFLATTCPGGVGMGWRPEYSESLRGRHVIVIPDEDPVNEAGYSPGVRHAAKICAALVGVATSVRLMRLPGVPPKGDVSDWWALNSNPSLTIDQIKAKFAAIITNTPPYNPASPPPEANLAGEAPALPLSQPTPPAAAPTPTPAPALTPTASPSPVPAPAVQPTPTIQPIDSATTPAPQPVPQSAAQPTTMPAGPAADAELAAMHALRTIPNVVALGQHSLAAAAALRAGGCKLDSLAIVVCALRGAVARLEAAIERQIFESDTVDLKDVALAIGTIAGVCTLSAADMAGAMPNRPKPFPAAVPSAGK